MRSFRKPWSRRSRLAPEAYDALIDFLIGHMPNTEELSEGERGSQYDGWLSQLKHWKRSV